jgi:hypothetical protein
MIRQSGTGFAYKIMRQVYNQRAIDAKPLHTLLIAR